jgi:predicted lipid-binding transport protein (Tim44 family)
MCELCVYMPKVEVSLPKTKFPLHRSDSAANIDAARSMAQVAVEAYGTDIDYEQLQGLWRLRYTTALDVVRARSRSSFNPARAHS